LVLPDFFTLKEDIAIARSECLINVYRTESRIMKDLYKTGEKTPLVKFNRGQFQFFNRKKKEAIYDKAKTTKRKSYTAVKPDFLGSFTNQWPIDRESYEELKKESLKRFKERHKKEEVKLSTETRKFLEIADFITPSQLSKMSKLLGKDESYFRKSIAKAREDAAPFLKPKLDEKIEKLDKIGGIP